MPTKRTNEEFLKELNNISLNYVPLEKYKNNVTKILFKCLIHNEVFSSTPKLVLEGHCSCKSCSNENKRKRYLKSNEDFLQELKDKNIDVIPLEEYKGNSTQILFKCSCGSEWKTTPERVLLGNHCKKCGYKKMLGKYSHFYNPNLTKEDREDVRYRYRNPKYTMFREGCFARDNYTCRVTGMKSTGNIVAHHLEGFNWDKQNRTNIDNGITLNENIHKEFHHLYGKGHNTKEQFLEFIDMLYSEKRISKKRYDSIKEQIKKIK